MNIKQLFATSVVALSLLGTVQAAEVLKVGSETVYPPFEYLDSASGKYIGFDIDLLDAIAKKAGFKPEIYSMGLDGLVPALQSGSIDVAVSALSMTPERKKRVDFTKPYYDAGLTAMVRADNNDKIEGPKDLENKTLCAEIGSSGSLYMSKIPGVKLRTFNSAAEAFLEINQGGCYAMINDRPVNEYFLTQKASKNLKLKELPYIYKSDEYGIAVRKGNQALLDRLNKALEEVRADGTYDKIYDKWFGNSKLNGRK